MDNVKPPEPAWPFGAASRTASIASLDFTMRIENIDGYYQWFASRFSPQERTLVLRDNREQMNELFGKQSFTFTGEFRCLNWMFDNGFSVVTAARRGTTIEVPEGTTLADAQKFTLSLAGALAANDVKRSSRSETLAVAVKPSMPAPGEQALGSDKRQLGLSKL